MGCTNSIGIVDPINVKEPPSQNQGSEYDFEKKTHKQENNYQFNKYSNIDPFTKNIQHKPFQNDIPTKYNRKYSKYLGDEQDPFHLPKIQNNYKFLENNPRQVEYIKQNDSEKPKKTRTKNSTLSSNYQNCDEMLRKELEQILQQMNQSLNKLQEQKQNQQRKVELETLQQQRHVPQKQQNFFETKNEKKYEQKQNQKKSYKNLEKEETDVIYIYNKLFNKQTKGRYSNELPCKHSKCGAFAYINNKGKINCENECYSYSISEAIFKSNKNGIDRVKNSRQYSSQYNQIRDQMELAQIITDSLKCSNKTEKEQNRFCQTFLQEIFKFFMKRNIN